MKKIASMLLRVWLLSIVLYPVVYFFVLRADYGSLRDRLLLYPSLAPLFIGVVGYAILLFYWGTRLKSWWINMLSFIGYVFAATVVFLITIIGVAPFSP